MPGTVLHACLAGGADQPHTLLLERFAGSAPDWSPAQKARSPPRRTPPYGQPASTMADLSLGTITACTPTASAVRIQAPKIVGVGHTIKYQQERWLVTGSGQHGPCRSSSPHSRLSDHRRHHTLVHAGDFLIQRLDDAPRSSARPRVSRRIGDGFDPAYPGCPV